MLVTGRLYRIGSEVKLMPELRPKDPLAAIERVRNIQPGATLRVDDMQFSNPESESNPWFKVSFPGSPITGWINSEALVGVDIKDVTEEGESDGAN